MHLGDLIPPPYARAESCAAPCAWCGSDGDAFAPTGAALAREVSVPAGGLLSRVGLWVALPEGLRALRVYVSGSAVRDGLIAPSALRLHTADASEEDAPAWRGAPLVGVTLRGERALSAELRGLRDGVGLARVAVLELAGLTRGEGRGEVTLRVVCEGGGCLTQRVDVTVVAAQRVEASLLGAYVAFVDDVVSQAERVSDWLDAVTGTFACHGVSRGVVTFRALAEHASSVEGVATVCPRGIDGASWRAALRQIARGRVHAVELWDPCAPDAFGASIALATRARPAACEMSAWVAPHDEAMSEALWRACEPQREASLQCVVGAWRDPVTPRVLTPWERERGLRELPRDVSWLGRFTRAPGERAWCRGVMRCGDDVRAFWPGAVSIERVTR